ncbi:MAG: hypothetical protein GYA18_03050 [Chloroflexi bacterium]|nr:hypothetical protein [Chloroflexota bacterium]
MYQERVIKSKFMVVLIISLILMMAYPRPIYAEGNDVGETPSDGEVDQIEVNYDNKKTENQEQPIFEEPEEKNEEFPHDKELEQDIQEEQINSFEVEEICDSDTHPQRSSEAVNDIVSEMNDKGYVIVGEDEEQIPLGAKEAISILSQSDPWFEDQSDRTKVIAYQSNCSGWSAPSGYSGGICNQTSTPVQDAVNAAYSGAVVYMDTGSYDETVNINKKVVLTSVGGSVFVNVFNLLSGADVTGSNGVYASLVNISEGASIQDGITLADVNGIVTVGSGTYTENVNIDKEGITLQGNSSATIDGTDSGSVITITADGVTVDGFEIINGYNGIIGETSNSTFQNNIIHAQKNYKGNNGVGILLWGENSNNQILNNTIFDIDRQGIFVGYADNSKTSQGNMISGNVIYDYGNYLLENGPDESAYGIQLWNANRNEIYNNEIYGYDGDWWFASAVYLCDANNNSINDNFFHDNNQGISQYNPNDPTSSNTARDNTIIGNVIGIHNYAGIFDAKYNYWGCSEGPGSSGCDTANSTTIHNPWLSDPDGDLIYQSSDGSGGYIDNCPTVYNPDQQDSDGDGIGDACETASSTQTPKPSKGEKNITTTTDNHGNVVSNIVLGKNETTNLSISIQTSNEYKEIAKKSAQEKIYALNQLNNEEKALVFQFFETLIDEPASINIEIPANTSVDGGQVNLKHITDESQLPAALNDAIFLGSMLEIEGIDEEGKQIGEFGESVTINFKLPDGLIIPTGMQIAIQYFDNNQGSWMTMPLNIEDGNAYAQISATGIYAFVLV